MMYFDTGLQKPLARNILHLTRNPHDVLISNFIYKYNFARKSHFVEEKKEFFEASAHVKAIQYMYVIEWQELRHFMSDGFIYVVGVLRTSNAIL